MFELYSNFFESTVIHQKLKRLTEHKPAWKHVTRTSAKYQKQQRPLTLLSAMVAELGFPGFGAAAKNLIYPETCHSTFAHP